MVYNTTQHPHSHTLSVYTVHLFGKGEEVEEKVEGQHYIRWVANTNVTDCISSL
jgi:hypothetical protein